MKRHVPVVSLLALLALTFSAYARADANAQYKAGSDFAK